jgi:hypothetical protein
MSDTGQKLWTSVAVFRQSPCFVSFIAVRHCIITLTLEMRKDEY